LLPGQSRSLSGVAFRAFILGTVLGLSVGGTLYLAFKLDSTLWRAPFFIAVLALFHFLEFWITARYNTPTAKTTAFLLSNGREYQIAHSAALCEHLITHFFFPDFQNAVISIPYPWTVCAGLVAVALGQAVRSAAMAQAGTNFNHQVQSKKNKGHELVTSGVYAWLRHPSYFGFFWWGLGTQLVLGNVVCLAAYTVVLWRFFSHRIFHEEKFLVSFFGEDYVKFRARTSVGIPGI
ncbi:ICMT-domain-containing protein, partial [Saccharata proteae CBS 121410]